MAERGGFEPPVELLTLRRFSKPLLSTTQPPLRKTRHGRTTVSILARSTGSVGCVRMKEHAPVAQLDRAFASEAKGQQFESARAHHSNQLFTGISPKNNPPSCPPTSRCLVNRRCVYCGNDRYCHHANPRSPCAEERRRYARTTCRFRHQRPQSPSSESRGARGLGKEDRTT